MPSSITIRLPPLDEVTRRWPEISVILKRATDRSHGCYEPQDVLYDAVGGAVHFCFVEDGPAIIGVAVLEIRRFRRRAVLHIPWLAGDRMAEWIKDFSDLTDDIARKHEITLTAIFGSRDGWERGLKQQGIEATATGTVVYREIPPA